MTAKKIITPDGEGWPDGTPIETTFAPKGGATLPDPEQVAFVENTQAAMAAAESEPISDDRIADPLGGIAHVILTGEDTDKVVDAIEELHAAGIATDLDRAFARGLAS